MSDEVDKVSLGKSLQHFLHSSNFDGVGGALFNDTQRCDLVTNFTVDIASIHLASPKGPMSRHFNCVGSLLSSVNLCHGPQQSMATIAVRTDFVGGLFP